MSRLIFFYFLLCILGLPGLYAAKFGAEGEFLMI